VRLKSLLKKVALCVKKHLVASENGRRSGGPSGRKVRTKEKRPNIKTAKRATAHAVLQENHGNRKHQTGREVIKQVCTISAG